ncbi:MAG: hypothetical protein LBC35_05780 [Coriobacteriales bacterium]|jgi:hypothetical protein|nr:hypothetical protein [Coriobacteriales bacterium]
MSAKAVFKVDTSVLSEVADSLAVIKSVLDSTRDKTDKASSEVGHSELSQALKEFESKWSGKRGKISDALEEVRTGVVETAKAVEEWDINNANFGE